MTAAASSLGNLTVRLWAAWSQNTKFLSCTRKGGWSPHSATSTRTLSGNRSTICSSRFMLSIGTSLARRSAPDVGRDVDDVAELGPLLVHRQLVPLQGAGEAALGAQAELVEGDVPGGF